ncbi:ZIP family metal transporter [Mycoplasmopsis alligatoris]|uniref:Metal cation transporter, zinc (Zn2+)-iron (Fe2+) permease (ZIP) family protein n=1 Tax=Mycoplasmopsis alligatoris A21JP2 TaxID=747682 RepID=D4XW44_9BACT|nr:ZIP family metal transporter [Mycoplasmopsis alligatoris]EFF41416.1 metal cation transporter, zinc (Zn2+)-iron (Fe2+) permease (ZIP) family protein [Mycoplasmopsis alligatoris A21JP2]
MSIQEIKYILNNDNLAKFLLVLVFLLIIITIPVAIAIAFPLLKSKLSAKNKIYLYAFSTGFFTVLALFGFMREALEISSIFSAKTFGANNTNKIYLVNIGVVAGGALMGLIFAYCVKFFISYKIHKKLLMNKKTSIFVHEHDLGTDSHHTHEHADHIFNRDDSIESAENALTKKTESKLKIIALLLILTHRIPEGFILGYNLNLIFEDKSSGLTIAFIISLILHLIPEEMIFYYRLRDSGFSKWKSLALSILFLLLFFPFMMFGIYFGSSINEHWWIRALMQSSIGGIFIFTSLVEFFPEFYHNNMDKKKWYITIVWLLIGIIFSIFVLSFHTHGQGL